MYEAQWVLEDGDPVYSGHVVHFWGVTGQRMGTYELGMDPGQPPYTEPSVVLTYRSDRVYFGGRMLRGEGGAWAAEDRLGSVGKFYRYGEARVGDPKRFATYERDEGGLDYAVNRYYWSGMGRFMTPDPYKANSGGPGDVGDPGSWNRYGYVGGDPVNSHDPAGLYTLQATTCSEALRMIANVGGSVPTGLSPMCGIAQGIYEGAPRPGGTGFGFFATGVSSGGGASVAAARKASYDAAAPLLLKRLSQEMADVDSNCIGKLTAHLSSAGRRTDLAAVASSIQYVNVGSVAGGLRLGELDSNSSLPNMTAQYFFKTYIPEQTGASATAAVVGNHIVYGTYLAGLISDIENTVALGEAMGILWDEFWHIATALDDRQLVSSLMKQDASQMSIVEASTAFHGWVRGGCK